MKTKYSAVNKSRTGKTYIKILFACLVAIIVELAVIGHELSIIIQNTVKI